MLVDYLTPFITKGKIADIGSGPVCRIGEADNIMVYPSDRRNYGSPIEVQDMEHLTYEDNFFDLVHCSNALDHTPDALAAVKEMIRVCKPGGWVYIRCWLDQHTVSGKRHFWDAKEDGQFLSPDKLFNLKDFGFKIEFVDIGGERRYNFIIATYQK